MIPERIVIVNDFAHVNGGASQVALSSALALSKRGLNVTFFSAVGPVLQAIADSDIKVILLDQQEIAANTNRFKAVTQGVWNRKAGRAMADLLSCCSPTNTIVHLHVWVKSLSSSVVREIIRAKIPLVVTLHDFFTVCPNGGLFDYQMNKICKLRPMSASCILKNCDKRNMGHKIWRVIRQTVQSTLGMMPASVEHFVTISDLSESILSQYLPASAVYHRVRNPISINKRETIDASANEYFLFLGRLDPEKGPLLMAKAAAMAGVPTVFVGDGPMRQKVKEILPTAKMTGWVTPEEVRGYLENARALIFPSLWYETQGLTVLEAAAKGIPAIVPDSSAAAEMVTDNETGLVFRGGDVTDLRLKMLLLSDDSLVTRLGRSAYDRYWDDPVTLDIHTDSLLELYGRIMAGHTSVQERVIHSNTR